MVALATTIPPPLPTLPPYPTLIHIYLEWDTTPENAAPGTPPRTPTALALALGPAQDDIDENATHPPRHPAPLLAHQPKNTPRRPEPLQSPTVPPPKTANVIAVAPKPNSQSPARKTKTTPNGRTGSALNARAKIPLSPGFMKAHYWTTPTKALPS
jgi:hypothetical protein